MNNEEFVKLLLSTIPILQRIKELPVRSWQFNAQELELLRTFERCEPQPELEMQLRITSVFSSAEFALLNKATSLIVTREVHGIDPLTGEVPDS